MDGDDLDMMPDEAQVNDWNIRNDHADEHVPTGNEWPCEHCGAPAGIPCQSDCVALIDYAAQEFAEQPDDEPMIDTAKRLLMASVWRLPYSGLLAEAPDYRADDTDVWLGKLAVWMNTYQQLMVTKVAELEAGNRKAIGLQLEKDVVRQFFGSKVPA